MNAARNRPVRRQSNAARRVLQFDRLLAEGLWKRNMRVEVDGDGTIAALGGPGAEDGNGSDSRSRVKVERIGGWAAPGVPNVHSHAFQRAMAGLAEGRRPDSFWSWRDVMYRFAARLAPEDLEAVAAQLYVELLKAGFTCVGEFHYLHHAADGRPYADEAETSRRVLAAARTAGMGLVHMPAVYETGGFGGRPLDDAQRRFRLDLDAAVRLHETLAPAFGGGRRLGWAVHSLRAVSAASFRAMAAYLEEAGAAPVHVHVAEQEREVRECLARRGARPVEWLLANAQVDERWCLVHATRATDEEVAAVARRRAVVGLCPVTEANLGDGLFPLAAFTSCGGEFGIGTDSHVSRSPVEELRLLEYGHRLASRNRFVRASPTSGAGAWERSSAGGARNGFVHAPPTSGDAADGPGAVAAHAAGRAATGRDDALSGAGGALLAQAWRAGARALAWNGGRVEPGARADFVVLDEEHPALAGRDGPEVLDSWVFSGTESPVRDVFVGGVQVVQDGRHLREEEVLRAFRTVAKSLARRI